MYLRCNAEENERNAHDLKFSSLSSSPWNFKEGKTAITSYTYNGKGKHYMVTTVLTYQRYGNYMNTTIFQEFKYNILSVTTKTILLGDGTVSEKHVAAIFSVERVLP